MDKVIVVGNGGREDAIARTIAVSPEVSDVWMTGTNEGALQSENIHDLTETDYSDVLSAAKDLGALVFIGPEQPAIDGLGDDLREEGVLVFGPGKEGAALEGSKVTFEDFCEKHGIYRPETHKLFGPDDLDKGLSVLDSAGGYDSWVVKASGPAAGKGAVLPESREEGRATIQGMLSGELFDGAGREAVMQRKWTGPEVSVFVVTDGKNLTVIPYFAQDHKRLLDGDQGLNTGGMGAYTNVPERIISADQRRQLEEMAHQIVNGLEEDGIDYKGAFFMGAMMDEPGGRAGLLELNVRFGDPETQGVVPMIQRSGKDFYRDLARPAAEGNLPANIQWSEIGGAALTVVLAAEGYPTKPVKGAVINGLYNQFGRDVEVFHAGTKKDKDTGQTVVNGGRVAGVTGFGETIDDAAEAAYGAIGEQNDGIHWQGMQYRTDIGYQARKTA